MDDRRQFQQAHAMQQATLQDQLGRAESNLSRLHLQHGSVQSVRPGSLAQGYSLSPRLGEEIPVVQAWPPSSPVGSTTSLPQTIPACAAPTVSNLRSPRTLPSSFGPPSARSQGDVEITSSVLPPHEKVKVPYEAVGQANSSVATPEAKTYLIEIGDFIPESRDSRDQKQEARGNAAVDQVDCSGSAASLETIVLEMQKSVQALMHERSSLEGKLSRLSEVSSEQVVQQVLSELGGSRCSSDLEMRLAKLERQVSVTVDADTLCHRLRNFEEQIDAIKLEESKNSKMLQQHASCIEVFQTIFDKLQEESVGMLHARQKSVEEKANQLQSDMMTWNKLHQESLSAVDSRVYNLEDRADSKMNVVHWENIHALCDNMQVQQQQLSEAIDTIRADCISHRGSVEAAVQQQIDVSKTLHGELVKDKAAFEARLRGLEDISIMDFCGNVTAQQQQHANLIHGLQSEIQTLLRDYLSGTVSLPSPQRTSSYPEVETNPSMRPSCQSPLVNVLSDVCSRARDDDCTVGRQATPLEDSLNLTKEAPDVISSGDLDSALQVELAKFPQFAVVCAVQNDLVRLPNLR